MVAFSPFQPATYSTYSKLNLPPPLNPAPKQTNHAQPPAPHPTSDGRPYPFLAKPKDDLRKDYRLMDFAGEGFGGWGLGGCGV